MTRAEIEAKVEVLNSWEAIVEQAQNEIEAIKDQIKEEMLERNVNEMEAGKYMIRWNEVVSNRFDTTSFKKLYGDLYKAFTKQSCSKRFQIC